LFNVRAKLNSAIVEVDKAVNVGFIVDKMALDSFLYHYLGFTPSIALPFYFICLSREGSGVAIFGAP